MRRCRFITLLGGAAAAWPLVARAQQPDKMRRIGLLSGLAENDPVGQVVVTALREELVRLGWVEGRNLRIDLRFGGLDSDRTRAYAAELVSLAPEVIVTDDGSTTRALQQQTRSIPIVSTGAGDPGVNGLVKNIAHPEGNITGITNSFGSIGGKWLELLKEAVPRIETVGLIHNPQLEPPAGSSYISSIEETARALALKTVDMPYRDAVDIVRAIDAFAAEPNGGLIIMPPTPSAADRQAIVRLSIQHRLPTVQANRALAIEGGLMTYTSLGVERARRAASFVDHILRGAKVSDLPVEYPAKFVLVINLKTAKAIGLTIPEAFLARADEVIE
jgi:putative tryptophan/tyrosine transport system substrate-binding protein